MAKKIGIDADQEVGREKAVRTPKAIKAEWMAAKMQLALPKSLARDFKEECNRRKLTHHGVLRDLAMCWLIANKEGLIADEYRAKIEGELKAMQLGAADAKAKQNAKLSAFQKRRKQQDREMGKHIIVDKPEDVSIHQANPFDAPPDDWKY